MITQNRPERSWVRRARTMFKIVVWKRPAPGAPRERHGEHCVLAANAAFAVWWVAGHYRLALHQWDGPDPEYILRVEP